MSGFCVQVLTTDELSEDKPLWWNSVQANPLKTNSCKMKYCIRLKWFKCSFFLLSLCSCVLVSETYNIRNRAAWCYWFTGKPLYEVCLVEHPGTDAAHQYTQLKFPRATAESAQNNQLHLLRVRWSYNDGTTIKNKWKKQAWFVDLQEVCHILFDIGLLDHTLAVN